MAHTNPMYNMEDMLERPLERSIERLQYQISLLRDLEEEQLGEIEILKKTKNINIEVAKTDFGELDEENDSSVS